MTTTQSPAERLYPLVSIACHDRLQIRGGTDYADVQRYKKAMLAGDTFPPITLAEIGGKLYVVDGHHRVEAAAAAGHSHISGTHRRMSLDEAQKAALVANTLHGRRYTQKEQQHAFASFIAEGLHLDTSGDVLPVRTIAALCPVYVFQTISRKLKDLGIDAPRDDIKPWYGTVHDSDGPSPEDLAQDEEIQLQAFRNSLAAAALVYGALSDTARHVAFTDLGAFKDNLVPPKGYLEI
jgi:hypothetical protein